MKYRLALFDKIFKKIYQRIRKKKLDPLDT